MKMTNKMMASVLCIAGALNAAMAEETQNQAPVEPTSVAVQSQMPVEPIVVATQAEEKNVESEPENFEEMARQKIEADNSLHLIGEKYDLSDPQQQETVIDNHFLLANNISASSRPKYQVLLRAKLQQILSTPIGKEIIGCLPADVKIPVNLGYSATKGNAGLCTWRGGHNIIVNLRDTSVRVGTFLHEITHGVQYCAGQSVVSETLAYGVGDEVNLQIQLGLPQNKKYYKLSETFMHPITSIKEKMKNLRKQMRQKLQQKLQREAQPKSETTQQNVSTSSSTQRQQGTQPQQPIQWSTQQLYPPRRFRFFR